MGRLKVAPDARPVVRDSFEQWINRWSDRLKEYTPYARLLWAYRAGWEAGQVEMERELRREFR